MEQSKSVLTIKEIAEILRCSKTHVGKLLSGQVPGAAQLVHVKIGRRKVVRKSAFDQWFDANENACGGAVQADMLHRAAPVAERSL